MGVEYNAVIVVGLHFNEFPDDSFQALAWTQDFKPYALYFDAQFEDSVFGYELAINHSYQPLEINLMELNSKAQILIKKFEDRFGQTPKVYLATNGD